MGTKKAKIEAIIEYSDQFPWDDVAVKSYIERQVYYEDQHGEKVQIKVTKVEYIIPERR